MGVDPVSGITLAGTQRVGIYVRMSGSDWYPTIPRKSGTKDYYHQLSWQLLKAEAPKEAETNLNDGYNQVRTVQTDLPPGLFRRRRAAHHHRPAVLGCRFHVPQEG